MHVSDNFDKHVYWCSARTHFIETFGKRTYSNGLKGANYLLWLTERLSRSVFFIRFFDKQSWILTTSKSFEKSGYEAWCSNFHHCCSNILSSILVGIDLQCFHQHMALVSRCGHPFGEANFQDLDEFRHTFFRFDGYDKVPFIKRQKPFKVSFICFL